MVIPLTFSRFIDAIRMLGTDKNRSPGIVLAVCCGVAVLLQFFAILCTQSRGPMLGLVVASYICIFVFLVLKRTSANRGFLCPALAIGMGCAVPVLIIAIVYMVREFSDFAAVIWLGGIIAVIGAAYVTLWRIPWGRNWLWLTWLVQTIAILLIFMIGPSQIIGQELTVPSIGRYTKLSGGSIDVRLHLWQTGYSVMNSGSQPALPDGSNDSFHFLRSVIGFGPECIWFPVNLHGPPELFEIHSSGSDRMHNDTFDNLMALGFVGAFAYLFLISAAIFFSLKYLDLIGNVHQKIFFVVFLVLGSGAGILLACLAGSPQMIATGAQAGLLIGLFVYIGWRGFLSTRETAAIDSRQILAFSILGSLIAHFVETAVGIAVTPTRTYFFLLLAILSILVSQRLNQGGSTKKRPSKPLPWRQTLLPTFMAIASFSVLTEAWSFIVNATAERSAVKLFIDNWFLQSKQQHGFPLPGNLILLILTIGGSIALAYSEKLNFRLSKRDTRKILSNFAVAMIAVWLAMGSLAAVFWAAPDPGISTPLDVSSHSEARITLFLLGLLVLLAVTVYALVNADSRKIYTISSIRNPLSWLGLLVAIGAFVLIFNLTVRPAWADISCHTARVYQRMGNLPEAIQVYGRALQLAPQNTRYLISLGRAQSRSADPNSTQMQESVKILQRAVELNPLDPFCHRSLGILYAQIGEQALNPIARNENMLNAIASFHQVTQLAPNNKSAYTDLGRSYFLSGDYTKAIDSFKKSMEMHPYDEMPHIYIGEVQYALNDLEGALESFTEAARLDRGNIKARKNISSMLILLGRKEEAIREDLATLEMSPEDLTLLRRLSSLYFSLGNYGSGLEFAHRAYDAVPEPDKPDFDSFLEGLQNQIR
jgi:tetratricopeptide (TPR) repeat protein